MNTSKREKENYMPDSVFINFKSDRLKKEYSESYLRLNSHQKDFIDIEKGFSSYDGVKKIVKNRNELLVKTKELYRKVSDKDYEVIGLGFVDKYSGFKTKFSEEFTRLDRSDMLSRIIHQPLLKSDIDEKWRNEYDHIVNEIKRLL